MLPQEAMPDPALGPFDRGRDKLGRIMAESSKRDQAIEEDVAPMIGVADRASLAERVARIQAEAAKIGFIADGRDDKAFMDEMWGER